MTFRNCSTCIQCNVNLDVRVAMYVQRGRHHGCLELISDQIFWRDCTTGDLDFVNGSTRYHHENLWIQIW
jgi:hypothetical protein